MDRGALMIKLRLLRDRLQMSQKDFGIFLEEEEELISQYESGVKIPTLDFLYKVAEKCCVSLDWFCGREQGYDNIGLMRAVEDTGTHYSLF